MNSIKQAINSGKNVEGINLGWILAIFGIAGLSLEAVVGKAAINIGFHPTTLLAVRFLLGAALLGSTIALQSPSLLKIDRKGLLICSICGVANGVGQLFFFWSLVWINASIAVMVLSLSPLFVLGYFAKKKKYVSFLNIFRFCTGLLGVYLLIEPGGQFNWLGVLFVSVATVLFAVQFILIPAHLQHYEDSTVTLYVVIVMTFVLVISFFVQRVEWSIPGWKGWLAIGVLAFVSTYLARLALYSGLRRIGGIQTALLSPIELFLTVVWSFIFLGEVFSLPQWIGGILILTSSILAIKG